MDLIDLTFLAFFLFKRNIMSKQKIISGFINIVLHHKLPTSVKYTELHVNSSQFIFIQSEILLYHLLSVNIDNSKSNLIFDFF